MQKYHLSAAGAPAPCKATISCPLSDDEGNPAPHGDFNNPKEAQAWAEKEFEIKYGALGAGVKPAVLSPREIRTQIATAEKSKSVWRGGDTALAAERTRANREEQDAKIVALQSMLPEGEPASQLELRRKVLFGEGGEATAVDMREFLDSYHGGYISDQEFKQRHEIHARLASAHGFTVGKAENNGRSKVTDLGHGWVMKENDPSRSWGGQLQIRDAEGKEIVRREATSKYATSDEALRLVGEHLRKNPEDTSKS